MTIREKQELELKREDFREKLDERKKTLDLLKEESEIRELERKYKSGKIQYSKILMAFILINCTVVELYSMFLMIYLQNLEPLSTLITTVIAESLSFAIYSAKSYKESKSESDHNLEMYRIDSEFNSQNGIMPNNDISYVREE